MNMLGLKKASPKEFFDLVQNGLFARGNIDISIANTWYEMVATDLQLGYNYSGLKRYATLYGEIHGEEKEDNVNFETGIAIVNLFEELVPCKIIKVGYTPDSIYSETMSGERYYHSTAVRTEIQIIFEYSDGAFITGSWVKTDMAKLPEVKAEIAKLTVTEKQSYFDWIDID